MSDSGSHSTAFFAEQLIEMSLSHCIWHQYTANHITIYLLYMSLTALTRLLHK